MYVTYTRIYGWSDYGGESSYQPGYRLENMMWMTLLVYDYIIPGDIERRPLAKALGQYVPAFMVPNVFRQVESMPLTKNGKIDRKALTAMYQEEKK